MVEGGKKKESDTSFISSDSFLGKEAFEKFGLTELLFNADDQELFEAYAGCSLLRTVHTIMGLKSIKGEAKEIVKGVIHHIHPKNIYYRHNIHN